MVQTKQELFFVDVLEKVEYINLMFRSGNYCFSCVLIRKMNVVQQVLLAIKNKNLLYLWNLWMNCICWWRLKVVRLYSIYIQIDSISFRYLYILKFSSCFPFYVRYHAQNHNWINVRRWIGIKRVEARNWWLIYNNT